MTRMERPTATWARLDLRDSAGRLIGFQRTHRFRHTATSLLNAGVPIHVVQRYLGHLSPATTMHYAQTLAETAEGEFLRYRKITADARDLQRDGRELYDMLQPDKRTDHPLPDPFVLVIIDNLRPAHRGLLSLNLMGWAAGCPGPRSGMKPKSDRRTQGNKGNPQGKAPAPGFAAGSSPTDGQRHKQPAIRSHPPPPRPDHPSPHSSSPRPPQTRTAKFTPLRPPPG